MTTSEPWTFGVEPLPQTEAAAPLLRRVTELLLSLEGEEPEVDELVATLRDAVAALERLVPPDSSPRIGAAVVRDARVYVDHSRDIGAFNPAFPEYRITVGGDRAVGTVTFPLVYEGPPGIVHGGFLALFFDCVAQHHNCDVGVAGKTTTLTVRYWRPTPVLTALRFDLTRMIEDGRIRTTGRLLRGDTVLCEAEIGAVAGKRGELPDVSPRRTGP
jgi:hypothetical protein